MSIKFIVFKNSRGYDMSNLVESIKWSGRKGAAARSLAVNLIDDDGYRHDRPEIDVEEGHQCVFYWKGKELFKGIFMRQEQSNKKTMSLVAYDNGIYLANNKDTFNYTDTKASDIFIDVCKRFGIPYSNIADISYRIPELPKPKTTGWDVICDALSLTYKATGIRYYPFCAGDEIQLLERRKNILQWVIETGVNLIDYNQQKDLENIKTRIKLLSKEGNVLAEAVDSNLEQKIGIFQDISQIDDEMNSAQLNELVKTMLEENNKTAKSLNITSLGLPEIITGVGVFIIIKELDISKTYYVEGDTHTFKGNYHNMKLKLVAAQDIDNKKSSDEVIEKEINKGDIVNFSGGYHYVSSNAITPVGGNRSAGKAKCTLIAKGAAHPFHLIGESGGSNVYGWVDASTVSK